MQGSRRSSSALTAGCNTPVYYCFRCPPLFVPLLGDRKKHVQSQVYGVARSHRDATSVCSSQACAMSSFLFSVPLAERLCLRVRLSLRRMPCSFWHRATPWGLVVCSDEVERCSCPATTSPSSPSLRRTGTPPSFTRTGCRFSPVTDFCLRIVWCSEPGSKTPTQCSVQFSPAEPRHRA